MEKVEIISLKKNEIKYIVKIKKRNFFPITIFLIGVLLCFFLSSNLTELKNNIAYVYNPVNSLFNDNSPAIFTSINALEKENLSFVIPVRGGKYNISNDGTLSIIITDSIMVNSIEAGVVEDIGITNNGIKYIKIIHCLNVLSIIENVDILGVAKGDIIKKGQDIATAKVGDTVTLRIIDNDVQVSNIKIQESKIIWQK